jgi:hypothetical protein
MFPALEAAMAGTMKAKQSENVVERLARVSFLSLLAVMALNFVRRR